MFIFYIKHHQKPGATLAPDPFFLTECRYFLTEAECQSLNNFAIDCSRNTVTVVVVVFPFTLYKKKKQANSSEDTNVKVLISIQSKLAGNNFNEIPRFKG